MPALIVAAAARDVERGEVVGESPLLRVRGCPLEAELAVSDVVMADGRELRSGAMADLVVERFDTFKVGLSADTALDLIEARKMAMEVVRPSDEGGLVKHSVGRPSGSAMPRGDTQMTLRRAELVSLTMASRDGHGLTLVHGCQVLATSS